MNSAPGSDLEATIRAALQAIIDPTPAAQTHNSAQAPKTNIIESGRVQGIILKDGNIGITLDVSQIDADAVTQMREQVDKTLRQIAGVLSVSIVLTAEKPGGRPVSADKKEAQAFERPEIFSRVKHVIAVASGKGGVGKSTVAANLALALSRQGLAVGLLDADIYGPSLPALFNITEKPEVNDDKKLIPIDCGGIATMSIGYMIPPDQAMIWRGPMVQAALLQLVNDVAWPELDFMVIDLPPGTGDIQLTMAQRFPVDAALIVTTPHALALADVRRAMAMFKKVGTPILGLVENMAFMRLENGQEIFPFGSIDLAADPQMADLERLAQLPLDPMLQQAIAGQKSIFEPANGADSALGSAFEALAQRVRASQTN